MAVATNLSFLLSTTIILLLIALMQLYKVNLGSTQLMTIIGGFLGSMLFVSILTAIGNLEKLLFGAGFQTKVPEIVISLLVSMIVSGTVHRVCVTTCLIFSGIALYYINRISQTLYGIQVANTAAIQTKKKK